VSILKIKVTYMTIKQRQHLLAYLGFYHGTVTGIWDEESKAAALRFQEAYGIEADESCGEESQKALICAVSYGMEAMPV
jgi:peptidoglycan hydrolase-like protein with peptidoglycan-binding domain